MVIDSTEHRVLISDPASANIVKVKEETSKLSIFIDAPNPHSLSKLLYRKGESRDRVRPERRFLVHVTILQFFQA